MGESTAAAAAAAAAAAGRRIYSATQKQERFQFKNVTTKPLHTLLAMDLRHQ